MSFFCKDEASFQPKRAETKRLLPTQRSNVMNHAAAPDQTTTETETPQGQEQSQLITGDIRRYLKFGRGGVPFLKGLEVAPGIGMSAERHVLEGVTCLEKPVHDGTVRFSWNSFAEVSQEAFRRAVANIPQSLRAEERAWISGLVPVFDKAAPERLRLVEPVLAEGVPCLCTYAIYQPSRELSDEKPAWRRAATFPIDAIVAQSSRTDPRPFASTPPRGHGNQRITGLSLRATMVRTGSGDEVNTYVPDGYLIAIPPAVSRDTDGNGKVTVTVRQSGHLFLVPGIDDALSNGVDLVANFLTMFEEVASVFAAIDAREAAFEEEPVSPELLQAEKALEEAEAELERAKARRNAALEASRALRDARAQRRFAWEELAPYLAAALNRDVSEFAGDGAGTDDQPSPDDADEQPGDEAEVAPHDDDEAETAPPV